MSEHETHYFHPNAEGKKKCADPDIFGCQKHQYTAQNEQCDGQESFGATVSDHSDNVTSPFNYEPNASARSIFMRAQCVLTIVDGNEMSRTI